MQCVNPLIAYRHGEGKLKILGGIKKYPEAADKKIWHEELGWLEEPMLLPCGKCIACRLTYAEQWADRCVLEAQKWEHNVFVTLTYDDEHVPMNEDGSYFTLKPEDFNLFIRRLRNRAKTSPIRYYMCGEYGSETMRPHYHAIIFNLEITDLKEYDPHKVGYHIYTSKWLNEIWKLGECKIGTVTPQSAQYTAKYITKKNDKIAYDQMGIVPEYARMSRRPGIASDILESIGMDIINGEELYTKPGHKLKIPKYYVNKLKEKEENVHDISVHAIQKGNAEERRLEARKSFGNFTTLEDLQKKENQIRIKNNLNRR